MLSGCSFTLSPLNSCAAPTRIVSLNRIVHFNNLNRFVCTWTVLAGKIISYQAVKIRLRQKVILLENFDQKTIRFNPYCLLRKSPIKNNTVQPILSFEKIFTKRQYGSTHIVFWEKFWSKGKTVKPILSFKKIFTKRKNGSTHIFFSRKFSPKDYTV